MCDEDTADLKARQEDEYLISIWENSRGLDSEDLSLGQKDPLEEEMVTYSSILA